MAAHYTIPDHIREQLYAADRECLEHGKLNGTTSEVRELWNAQRDEGADLSVFISLRQYFGDKAASPQLSPKAEIPSGTGSIEKVLKGLGPEARFRPTVGKVPGAKGEIFAGGEWKDDDGTKWNTEEWKWLTAEEVSRTMARKGHSYTGIGLMTGSKVGGYC